MFLNHDRLIDAIQVHKNSVWTGGRDRRLFQLNRNTYQVIKSWDFDVGNKFNLLSGSRSPKVKAIAFSDDDKEIFIGTMANEIYKFSLDKGTHTPIV